MCESLGDIKNEIGAATLCFSFDVYFGAGVGGRIYGCDAFRRGGDAIP
jgi:hypothetical protein